MEILKEGSEELYGICRVCGAEYKWKTSEGWRKTCQFCGLPVKTMSLAGYQSVKAAESLAEIFAGPRRSEI